MENALMKPLQVGEYLMCGRSKTYQMLMNGTIPGVVRIGRSLRVNRKALDEWIAAGCPGASDKSELKVLETS